MIAPSRSAPMPEFSQGWKQINKDRIIPMHKHSLTFLSKRNIQLEWWAEVIDWISAYKVDEDLEKKN